MRTCVLLIFALACSAPSEALTRTPPARSLDPVPAVSALRESRFDDAVREASGALGRDARNARAAAVRALATYEQSATQLVTELAAVLDQADGMKFFDHERGRAAWVHALDALEAIDKDLVTAAGDPSFSLELCLACWNIDWNRNGEVDERDRHMLELEYDADGVNMAPDDPRRRPTFRFDAGDIYWARAMLAFQRAAIELVLAYRWSELDKLFLRDEKRIVIKLVDPGRVKHAQRLILDGLTFSDRSRELYRAETDDDREWLPNPAQHSHAIPLPIDDRIYQTWAEVVADVRRLVGGEEGLSLEGLHELGRPLTSFLIAPEHVPHGYIDVGRMLRQPADIVLIDPGTESSESIERMLRGLLGNGFQKSMRASPLVERLRHMRQELELGSDTLEKKLRYLIWIN